MRHLKNIYIYVEDVHQANSTQVRQEFGEAAPPPGSRSLGRLQLEISTRRTVCRSTAETSFTNQFVALQFSLVYSKKVWFALTRYSTAQCNVV